MDTVDKQEKSKLPQGMQEAVQKIFEKRKLQESYQQEKFGYSPSIMSCMLGEKRIVMCNNKLHQGDWRNPRDYLISYLKTTIGEDWLETESKKGLHEQHEIVRWYREGRRNIKNIQDHNWTNPNGAALALCHLAYDLFILDCSNKLSERLLKRLRNKENFNGARYEALVFATLIRAGFEIEFIDEVSGENGKVAECKAKHVATGEYILVEAKTRNVKGVLGSAQGKANKVRLYDKFKDAMEKNINCPYVISIDINLVAVRADLRNKNLQLIRKEIKKFTEIYTNNLPNLIVTTNIPFHYGKINEPPNAISIGHITANKPKHLVNTQTIIAITKAMEQYSALPSEFDEAEKFVENFLKDKNQTHSEGEAVRT